MDSGAWIALLIGEDLHHDEASQFFKTKPRPRWVVTSTVLAETYTWLRYNAADPVLAIRFMEESLAAETSGELETIRPNRDLETRAVSLGRRFSDLDLSWPDLISLAVCQERGITEVFGFDRHFHAAGLILVPG